MNRIKDILHDINDILVAVLVLCIAALVILSRIDAIMAYPEKAAAEQSSRSGYVISDDTYGANVGAAESPDNNDGETPDGEAANGEAANTDNEASDLGTDAGGSKPAEGDEKPAESTFSLYIASGQSMNEVAKNLVKLGFFESNQDFFNTLSSLNADTRVQAGTFILPAASTKEDVIKIITKMV